jgi:hypothetical protein
LALSACSVGIDPAQIAQFFQDLLHWPDERPCAYGPGRC